MSTNSVSNSALASSSLGISGLASGIDTDSIVDKLISASSIKIDKVKQQQQLLEWKQEDYRTLITEINAFYDKYFTTTSSMSALMSVFYSTKATSFVNTSLSNYISITATSAATTSEVKVGNIQVATASTAKSATAISAPASLSFSSADVPIDLTGKSFVIDIDGVSRTITFSNSYNSVEDFAADLQTLTNSAFGSGKVTVSTDGDKILLASSGTNITISEVSENNAFASTGLTIANASSRVSLSAPLSNINLNKPLSDSVFQFTINGVEFNFDSTASLNDIMNAINKSAAGVKVGYSSVTDKLTFTATSTGAANSITISDKIGNLMESLVGPLGPDNYKPGTDASIEIDGVTVTRSTNSFTIDGISYNLKGNTTESSDVKFAVDVDKVYNNIKTFIDDYNALLDKINSKLSEERFKDYEPLTDAQREKLSENQIEKWEAKARSGLLRNDSTLQSMVSELRSAMYATVYTIADNNVPLGVNLNSIGISTGEWKNKGKLFIDETKLKEAIANDPQAIASLFSQRSNNTIYSPDNSSEVRAERFKESGLMYRLSDIIQDYARKTQGGGLLLKIAGYSGTTTESENSISKTLKSYNSRLDRLQESLKRERARYYAQFAAMEKYISQANTQSSYLSSFWSN